MRNIDHSFPHSFRNWPDWAGKRAVICASISVGLITTLIAQRPSQRDSIDLQPDVIFSGSTPATAAIQQETRSTPIIFAIVTDPVGSGFVAGLPRPGGNLTGFVHVEGSMAGKWLQMIKEIAPRITRAVAMYNPDAAPFVEYFLRPFEAAAQALAVTPITTTVRNDVEIETAIDALGHEHGLILLPDSFLGGHRATIIAASTRNKVPAIFSTPTFAKDGGLLSYGPNFPDIFRRAAGYVDRILKGDKTDDLPVQLPTKYDLVINLRTAKALGSRSRRRCSSLPMKSSNDASRRLCCRHDVIGSTASVQSQLTSAA